MTAPVVDIHHLQKSYREGWFGGTVGAVHDVSLSVEAGQIWALAGPNGAGKTTTLHCLVGLLRPDRGSVRIFGQPASRADVRQRIGFQSEIFFSYPRCSAESCLTFYGQLSGMSGEPLKARVRAMLSQVGLEAFAKRRVGAFSKGMVQRLGLAQSLLHDPDLLIWDEPTTGLDPEGRRLVLDLATALKGRGKTLLLSSHIIPDIERVCDHVAVMAGGRVLMAGGIDALRAQHGGKSLEDIYLSIMGEHGHV